MLCLYLSLAIILLVEIYSVGVIFVAKSFGKKEVYKNLIPFYAFKTAREISGPFSILTIPVKKFATMMITVSGVAILALAYASWGQVNLPETSAKSLWQIMWLVAGLTLAIFYFGMVCSTPKICRRFSVEREKLCVVLSLLIVTIPFIYYFASKNTARTDAQMY